MRPKMKLITLTGILAVVIGGSAMLYNSLSSQYSPSDNTQSAQTPISGKAGTTSGEEVKAPDFVVSDGSGKSVKLSDFQGKPIVVNFWASWCPPCRVEMPEFDKLSHEFTGDVIFLMVNMTDGTRETVDKAKSYVNGQGFTFPVYYDTEQEAAYAYGITALPTTVFIDKNGYIVKGIRGTINETTLRSSIAKITSDNK